MKRNKWLLLGSSSTTHLGDIIFEYALRWWIASISSSATLLALVLSLETIVGTFFNLIGGVMADRINRKKLLIITDIISGFGCLILYFFIDTSTSGIYLIIVINVILAITYSIYSPSMKAIVSEAIDMDDIPKTNALINGTGEVIKIVGPLLGILLINSVGVEGAFLINAFSFLLSAILETFIFTKTEVFKNDSENATFKTVLFEDLKDSWRYIKKQKELLNILVLASVANFFLAGYMLLLPFLSNTLSNGASLYGQLLTAQAIGGILAAFIYHRLKLKLSAYTIGLYLFLSGIGVGLLGALSMTSVNNYYLLVFTGLYGLGITLFNIQFVTYVQQNTDKNYIGRVFSFIFTIAILFIPLGNFFFTWLYEFINNWCFVFITFGLTIIIFIYSILIKKEDTLKSKCP